MHKTANHEHGYCTTLHSCCVTKTRLKHTTHGVTTGLRFEFCIAELIAACCDGSRDAKVCWMLDAGAFCCSWFKMEPNWKQVS